MLGVNVTKAEKNWNLTGSQTFSSITHHSNGGRVKAGGGRGRRGTVSHVHQPKAPNNTSSFLINDLQERAETTEQKKNSTASNHSTTDNPSTLPQGHRPRSYSSLAAVSPEDVADQQLEDSFEEEDDSEFAAEFDNASMERIENLSRPEVNREMLCVERVNRRLYDCVDTLKSENHRLKNLLERHGITYPIPQPGGNPLGSLNMSRSSSIEEGEAVEAGADGEEEVKDNDRRTLSD